MKIGEIIPNQKSFKEKFKLIVHITNILVIISKLNIEKDPWNLHESVFI